MSYFAGQWDEHFEEVGVVRTWLGFGGPPPATIRFVAQREAAGHNAQEISEWERGRRRPRIPQLRALAQVLRVPFDTLIQQIEEFEELL